MRILPQGTTSSVVAIEPTNPRAPIRPELTRRLSAKKIREFESSDDTHTQATAYCCVTSLPGPFCTSLNSSGRNNGSSLNSTGKPAIFSSFLR